MHEFAVPRRPVCLLPCSFFISHLSAITVSPSEGVTTLSALAALSMPAIATATKVERAMIPRMKSVAEGSRELKCGAAVLGWWWCSAVRVVCCVSNNNSEQEREVWGVCVCVRGVGLKKDEFRGAWTRPTVSAGVFCTIIFPTVVFLGLFLSNRIILISTAILKRRPRTNINQKTDEI